MIELQSDEGWMGATHLIPAAVLVGLVIVGKKHAKASPLNQIATVVLVVVDDLRYCPKTQRASLGTVESVSGDHSVPVQEVDYVALTDKFRAFGHPDGEGMRMMLVDCIRQSVILRHLLMMMESQRTRRGETVAAEWRERRRGNYKIVGASSGHFAGSCWGAGRK